MHETPSSQDATKQEICSGHDYSKIKVRGQGQGHSDSKMVRDNQPCQDAFTHQIWNPKLKEYRGYAPDSMLILEIMSEVKIKVTVTQRW